MKLRIPLLFLISAALTWGLASLLFPNLGMGQGNVLPGGGQAGSVNGNSLSNALRTVSNNRTLTVTPGGYTNRTVAHGHYKVPPFYLYRKTNVNLVAYGGNFYFPTCLTAMVIKECKGITVEGMGLFNGKNTNASNALLPYLTNLFSTGGVWAAVSIIDSEDVTIKNCTIRDMWDHGIVADAGGGTFNNSATNGIKILNNTFSGCGWYWTGWPDGAAIVPAGGWLVANNYIYNTTRGIEVYPYIANVDAATVTIVGNHLFNIGGSGLLIDRARVNASGNTIANDPNYPVFVADNHGIRVDVNYGSIFSGNVIRGKNEGFYFNGPCTNLQVSGNMVSAPGSSVYLNGFPLVGSRIVENYFDGAGYGGLYGNGTIFGNDFDRNRFANCGTNAQNFAINFNAGTLSTNTFLDNIFWCDATNAVIASIAATGTGNVWSGTRRFGNYTKDWDISALDHFWPEVVSQVNGRLGVGTNSPQAVFEIFGTNTGHGYLFRVGSPNLGASGTNAVSINTNGSLFARSIDIYSGNPFRADFWQPESFSSGLAQLYYTASGLNFSGTGNVSVGTNLVMQTAIARPTVTGTNNGIFWASNNTLFWTWTAGGTTTNQVKIAGP